MRSGIRRALAAVALATVLSAPGFALETKPYDAAAFKAAQDAGKPVVVHVHADWCPTCKSQQKVFKSLESKPEYADLTVYTVSYDDDAEAVKKFKARSQSTLVAYKGDKETGRSAGETKQASIETLLNSALK